MKKIFCCFTVIIGLSFCSCNRHINGVEFSFTGKVLIKCPTNIKGHYSIPNSVISIGSNAFFGCSGLTSLTIPDSVEKIANGTFKGCNKLTKIILLGDAPFIHSRVFDGSNPNLKIYISKNALHQFVINEGNDNLQRPNAERRDLNQYYEHLLVASSDINQLETIIEKENNVPEEKHANINAGVPVSFNQQDQSYYIATLGLGMSNPIPDEYLNKTFRCYAIRTGEGLSGFSQIGIGDTQTGKFQGASIDDSNVLEKNKLYYIEFELEKRKYQSQRQALNITVMVLKKHIPTEMPFPDSSVNYQQIVKDNWERYNNHPNAFAVYIDMCNKKLFK